MKWFTFSRSRNESKTTGHPAPSTSGLRTHSVEPHPAERILTLSEPLPKRILLVKGHAPDSGRLVTLLNALSPRCAFQQVSSSEEAWRELDHQSQPFDAILADGNLDDLSSVDFLNELTHRQPQAIRMLHLPLTDASTLGRFTGLPPHFIGDLATPGELEETLAHAFQLERWMAAPTAKLLLSKMENLPAVPSLYAQVMAELRSDDPSVDAVARLIAKDPALTAKMLQTVNSPIFALRRPVGTAVEAVTFLGAERTKALILMACLSLHGTMNRCEGFSQENFWHHSLSVATWARCLALAEMRDAGEADQAFTAGILHDVGKLLLASNIASDYGATIALAQQKHVTLQEAELERLNISHAYLGASLLGTWGLPMPVLEAIAWHHRPSESSDRRFSLLTAVHVGNALEYERKGSETTDAVSQLDWDYLSRLGIDTLVDRWRKLIGCPAQPLRP